MTSMNDKAWEYIIRPLVTMTCIMVPLITITSKFDTEWIVVLGGLVGAFGSPWVHGIKK